jgi:hypothetical protein
MTDFRNWSSKQGGIVSDVDSGIISRLTRGVKYIISGVNDNVFFGPENPIDPQSQETFGRLKDYPVAYNLQQTKRAYERTPFEQMRNLADSYDLLRLVIETRKDQISQLEWRIKVRFTYGNKPSKQDETRLAPKIKEIGEFLMYPDKELDWDTWIREVLEDVFVTDALSIYPRMTKGGSLYSLDVMDGTNIVRKIDADGRTPQPPDPAYQQILKGLPAVNYSKDQLIYRPRNVRSHKFFGYSPVEQIIMTVNIALRRQLYLLNYYTEGSVPDAILSTPESWTTNQIATFQMYWDDLLEGDLAQRRKVRFVPSGVKTIDTKDKALTNETDEWLARIVCASFSINPQLFTKLMNRATAETIQEASIQEGLMPIQTYIKNLINFIIWKYFGTTELEFDWEESENVSPEANTTMNSNKLKCGQITLDEWRDMDGKEPIPNGLGSKYIIYTSQGGVLLEDVINGNIPSNNLPTNIDQNIDSTSNTTTKLHKVNSKKKVGIKPINRDRKLIIKNRIKLKSVITKALKIAKIETMKVVNNNFSKLNKEAGVEDQIQKILDEIDLSGWLLLVNPTQDILDAVAQNGIYQSIFQIGLDSKAISGEMTNLATQYASEHSAELITEIDESTRNMIRTDITKALETGETSAKLSDTLQRNYAFSEQRADLITRTEVRQADITGNMIAYKESGVVNEKSWICLGGDTCDECQANEDEGSIDINDSFSSGDDAPLAHPGCECDIFPSLDTDL